MSGMSTLEAAWDALRAALPPRWVVGRPSQHGAAEWVLYAHDPTERPKVGKRTREVEARATTELGVVLEMARLLDADRG